MTEPPATAAATPTGPARRFRRFRVEVLGGDAWAGDDERCTVGSHPSNDLVLEDPTVSRFHCEIAVAAGRFRVRDLGSRNGTVAGDVSITDGAVPAGALLVLGHSRIRIAAVDSEASVPASDGASFGGLIGASIAMRELFARLARAAASDATVLLEGETGTGKEGAAAALHAASARAGGPFAAVDCGAIPGAQFDAELLGDAGALDDAAGGTLVLDEVGELAPELQTKLLRVLETRTVARDVRIIAATNRDLRERVNAGAFRPDLYYRLAVLRIALPPLRDHLGDLPALVAHLLDRLGAPADRVAELTAPAHLAQLAAAPWPGNVRELRNHLEQALVFGSSPVAAETPATYDAARKAALDRFERDYVADLMRDANGNVAAAAKAAGVNRAYLYRLIRRHRG